MGPHLHPTRPARLLLGALWALVAVYAADVTLGVLPGGLSAPFQKFASAAVFFLAAFVCALRGRTGAERAVWRLFAAGLLLWACGQTYWVLALWDAEVIPVPSYADIGFVGFYLPVYVALGLLFRARVRANDVRLWLDGLVGALAVAAVAAAVVFEPVLTSTGGDTGTVVVGLVYPLADLLLLLLLVGGVVLAGSRVAGSWSWVAAGLVVFGVTDSWYLYTTATGTFVPGGVFDVGWPLAAVLLATAAWRPPGAAVAASGRAWRTIVLPIAFALVGLGLLILDHLTPTSSLAVGLAAGALVAVLARLVVTYSDNVRMLAASRIEATTDALTGLGNRRKLLADLEAAVLAADDARPVVLAIFDLDGFKSYNDSFGHPAGDALLARLGRQLVRALPPTALAYRMGGDEFCLLAPVAPEEDDLLVRAAARALGEHGEGFAITSSFGAVRLPAEARDGHEALALADRRMYGHKHGGRASAGRQSGNVLLQALAERHPHLGPHGSEVAELAEAVARRLAVPAAELERVRLGAELHDVGKVAIPETILRKPGPLDDAEWAFMRRHTIIGERILLAAPALTHVAAIVRASHERMDGTGYPDGLRGEDIPLPARIVAVCDAYDAMRADRSYQPPMTHEDALAELRRCSGTQFDARVVEAFAAVLAEAAPVLRAA